MRAILYFSLCFLLSPLSAQSQFGDKIGRAAPNFSFFTAGGNMPQVKEFRGKWLLLQFGGSWCPASEVTAEYFSRMRRALGDRPFEFVEIYVDPTLRDVELFSLTKFSGVRGIASQKEIPEFYSMGFIPVWYLINPDGVVQAAGAFELATDLQIILEDKLSGEKGFEGISLEPSPREAARESALALMVGDRPDRAAQLAAWEAVLAIDPHDAWAICGKARALAWTKGYSAANQFLRETISGMPSVPPQVQVFAAVYGLNDSAMLPAIEGLASLGEEYPESENLRAWNLIWTKLPESLTPAEARTLAGALQQPASSVLKPYLALYLASQGKEEVARQIFAENNSPVPWNHLDEAAFLHAQGEDKAALERVGPAKGNFTAAAANPAQAWQEMLRFTVVEDWPQVEAFAIRYEEVRPGKVQGLLFQWLAALRMGDPAKAEVLRKKVEAFMAASPRYKSRLPLLEGKPTRDDFLRIGDENIRFDTALACLLLAEMGKTPVPAAKIAEAGILSFPPGFWASAILRALSSPSTNQEARPQPDAPVVREK